jgi:hypothetical protein
MAAQDKAGYVEDEQMSVRLNVKNLPARVTEAQIRTALGPLGKVLSVRLSGSSCVVEIESATVQKLIDSSGIGEIRLADALIDSSGIGELSAAKISLA